MSARRTDPLAVAGAVIRQPAQRVWRKYLIAAAIVALWGSSFPLTKASLAAVGPMGIAFLRWAISALFLGGWVAARGRMPVAITMVRAHGSRLLWLGFTGVTLYYALQNVALMYTSATNAGILSNMVPVFIVIIAVLGYGERLHPLGWLTLVAAFIGATLVSQGAGHFTIAGAGLRGDLLMIVASVFAALYSVQSKQVTAHFPADLVIAAVSAAGAVLLLPLALAEGFSLALPPLVWGALLLLGLGSGAIANLWWLDLLSQLDASRAGMILLAIPVFATALAVVFLNEPLTPLAAAGAVLVLAGVGIMQRNT